MALGEPRDPGPRCTLPKHIFHALFVGSSHLTPLLFQAVQVATKCAFAFISGTRLRNSCFFSFRSVLSGRVFPRTAAVHALSGNTAVLQDFPKYPLKKVHKKWQARRRKNSISGSGRPHHRRHSLPVICLHRVRWVWAHCFGRPHFCPPRLIHWLYQIAGQPGQP